MTTLYWRTAHQIPLKQALAATGLVDAVALLSTPTDLHIARLDGHQMSTADGGVTLDHVYEARVFTPSVELRWLQEADGAGRAVALAEDPATLPADFTDEADHLADVDPLPAHYLLWGRVVGQRSGGWTATATSRIGTLWFPIAGIPAEHRLRLRSVEYVATEPEHGNAYIAEERLERIAGYLPQTSDEEQTR